jgi:hypothetical protein
VDTKAGVLHVRSQLSRGGRLVALKTGASRREVVLSEPLAAVLRAQRERALAAGHHGAEDFVFATRLGTPTTQRNATRTILRAANRARHSDDLRERLASSGLAAAVAGVREPFTTERATAAD